MFVLQAEETGVCPLSKQSSVEPLFLFLIDTNILRYGFLSVCVREISWGFLCLVNTCVCQKLTVCSPLFCRVNVKSYGDQDSVLTQLKTDKTLTKDSGQHYISPFNTGRYMGGLLPWCRENCCLKDGTISTFFPTNICLNMNLKYIYIHWVYRTWWTLQTMSGLAALHELRSLKTGSLWYSCPCAFLIHLRF